MNKFQRARMERKKEEERLKGLESKFTSAGNEIGNHKPIGVYLHQTENPSYIHTASDRIRGKWIIDNCPDMELFNPKANYDVVIFHVPSKEISKYGRIKILDICDKMWDSSLPTYHPNFIENIYPVDAIVVPTDALKNELIKITDKPVYVIGDGHDFDHYKSKKINTHSRRAQEVVWFGYAQNAASIAPFINYIKSWGLKLKVISDNQAMPPLQHADIFVPWNPSTYIEEISKSDFAFLPPNNPYKSNNREITALLSGIPVAKDKAGIARFMFMENRRHEMIRRQTELANYDVKLRAAEYMEVIRNIEKSIKTVVYTANCGKYDSERNDIKIFTDSPSDIFRNPVMNAKIYKVLSHKYFQAPTSIYLDANIFLKVRPKVLIEEFLGDADMALFRHPVRDCLYKEHEPAKKRIPMAFHHLIDEQVRNYKADGMPENFGLAECGMLIRKNNDVVNEFNEKWWAEICRYSNRDQMSFPYVWWKMKERIKIKFIEGISVREHKYFKYIHH